MVILLLSSLLLLFSIIISIIIVVVVYLLLFVLATLFLGATVQFMGRHKIQESLTNLVGDGQRESGRGEALVFFLS